MGLLNIKYKNGYYNKIRLILIGIISIILISIIILKLFIKNILYTYGTDVECGSCVGTAPMFPWISLGLVVALTIVGLWVMFDDY